jgi:hypothetical protein
MVTTGKLYTPPQSVGGVSVVRLFEPGCSLGQIIDVTNQYGAENRWYRGEPRLYETPAYPHIARIAEQDFVPEVDGFSNKNIQFPLGVFTSTEREVLNKFKDNPPADPYFQKLVDGEDHPAWLAFARHHGRPTRMLDVSADIRVALYFACQSEGDEFGLLYVFVEPFDPFKNRPNDPSSLAELFDAALGDKIPSYRDHSISQPGLLEQHAPQLADSWQVRFDHSYLWRCESVLNERMNAQSGAFLWRGDPSQSLLGCSGSHALMFTIHPELKNTLVEELRKQNISEATLCL